MKGTMLVATASQGVIRSNDDGRSWQRTPLEQALEFDGVVRSLVVHPTRPQTVFAGADVGLVRSDDAGATWTRVPGPFTGHHLWTISIAPGNPDLMLVGSGAPSRARVWLSEDGGASWEQLPPDIPERCAGVSRPRILTSTIDPLARARLWFGIEEGGLWHSADRGLTWHRIDDTSARTEHRGPLGPVTNSDVHAVLVHPGRDQVTHLVVTVNALWTSTDGGESWFCRISADEFGLRYARTVAALADGETLLFACGDSTPGSVTKIFRSVDAGVSWEPTELVDVPGSTVWGFGVHPDDPDLVLAGTKYGNLLRSTDGGRSWRKEWREFPEISAVAWTPEISPDNPRH